jgi:phosphoribosylanthranilate isomerase
MFVKICGLSTPDAIEAAIEAGADAVGFVLAESPRRVTAAKAAALAASVPAGVLAVAVMRHPTPAQCAQVFDAFVPDYLQTDAEDFAAISLPHGCRALPVYRDTSARSAATLPARLLFEGHTSGSGKTADWALAHALAARTELILAGGLDTDNIAAAIAAVRPFGVDVSSGVESRRGTKDRRKILEFVSRVRELEHTP